MFAYQQCLLTCSRAPNTARMRTCCKGGSTASRTQCGVYRREKPCSDCVTWRRPESPTEGQPMLAGSICLSTCIGQDGNRTLATVNNTLWHVVFVKSRVDSISIGPGPRQEISAKNGWTLFKSVKIRHCLLCRCSDILPGNVDLQRRSIVPLMCHGSGHMCKFLANDCWVPNNSS